MIESRKKILTQAETLFFRYGIKSITMDDVAREIGISKKTLYQHVDNKTDLLNQVLVLNMENEQKDLKAICAAATDAIDEILGYAKHGIEMLRDINPTTIYDLQKYHKESWKIMESLHREHLYDIIKQNIENGINQGLYRKDLNADIIAKLYTGQTLLVVNEDTFPLKEYNKEHLFEAFIQYHIHGIASTKGLKKLEKYLMKEN